METYENDKDLSELIYTEITDEKVLDFFFKKSGKVNINNLQYCIGLYSKNDLAQNLVSLEAKGLIQHMKHPYSKVTIKARWIRFRDNKNAKWIIAAIGLIAAIISILITKL